MKIRKNILILLLISAYLISVSGFISRKEKELRIRTVAVNIKDSLDNHFIQSADILEILKQGNFNAVGQEYGQVNLRGMEEKLRNRQIIKTAEVYITEPGVIHIDVSQKNPFLHVFNASGKSYYLDKEGNIIAQTSKTGSYLLVANGKISEPFNPAGTLNIYDADYDSLSRPLCVIYDVFRLASYITEDKLWNAQIEQIYVNDRYEYELIPRVGSQIIEFGNLADMEHKFEKLKILYMNGFNNLGWNDYSKISLKYKNQVVCTKIN